MENKICKLFGIQYPIVQGGMVWISGARLAAAVSEAGGLGLIGSGSMPADVLREHIRKAKSLTDKPFGVNVPMLYSKVDQTIQVMEEEGVKIIFTSAGNPAAFTPALKEKGFTVVHVVSSVKFALKAQAAGVDAVVAEGFEAGGHNGREGDRDDGADAGCGTRSGHTSHFRRGDSFWRSYGCGDGTRCGRRADRLAVCRG